MPAANTLIDVSRRFKKPPLGGFFTSSIEMLNETLAYCKERAAPKSAGDSAALMTHTGMSLR
jgi:hypothetical protein